jgi:hypothetical protein
MPARWGAAITGWLSGPDPVFAWHLLTYAWTALVIAAVFTRQIIAAQRANTDRVIQALSVVIDELRAARAAGRRA